jgi:hypothetical protein
MGVSIVSFMLLDLVKVFVIKQWSFELTAKLWPTPKRKAERAVSSFSSKVGLDRENGMRF